MELGQSPFLSLVPDKRVQGTLGLMSRSQNTPVTGDVAREICERTFSAAVVQGSIRDSAVNMSSESAPRIAEAEMWSSTNRSRLQRRTTC